MDIVDQLMAASAQIAKKSRDNLRDLKKTDNSIVEDL